MHPRTLEIMPAVLPRAQGLHTPLSLRDHGYHSSPALGVCGIFPCLGLPQLRALPAEGAYFLLVQEYPKLPGSSDTA